MIIKELIIAIFVFLPITIAYASQDCCSWHGGVAGCDNQVGKLICSDGTFSSSCVCPKTSTLEFDVNTQKGLLQACTSSNLQYQAYCTGYIKAAIEMYAHMKILSQFSHLTGQARIICLRKLILAAPSDAQEATKKVVQYFRKNPGTPDRPADLSVLLAIQSFYPKVEC